MRRIDPTRSVALEQAPAGTRDQLPKTSRILCVSQGRQRPLDVSDFALDSPFSTTEQFSCGTITREYIRRRGLFHFQVK